MQNNKNVMRPNADRRFVLLATLVALAMPGIAIAAATDSQKCEAGKNSEAGKYTACMHKARQKFVTGGESDMAAYDDAVLGCNEKYSAKWSSLETKAGGGVCPSEGDVGEIQGFLDACISSVEDKLHGGSLPQDVESCNADLLACTEDLEACAASIGAPKTGQTTCYSGAGAVVACAGSGQDGETQHGVVRGFTDNGDGTITDEATGLMWEKLSNDGSIHDKDTTYSWTGSSTKINSLNTAVFAGYNDWRIPNINELESLRNYTLTNPAAHPEFNVSCVAACTVLTCSCTRPDDYWSSSTYQTSPDYALVIRFGDGSTSGRLKTASTYVRAVRGGA